MPKKPAPVPVTQSRRYRSFTKSRDLALGRILNKYLAITSDAVAFAHAQVDDMVLAMVSREEMTALKIQRLKPDLERRIEHTFKMSAAHIVGAIRQMRVSTYTLAHAGEVEGLARAQGVPIHVDLPTNDILGVMAKDAPSGGPLEVRIGMFFDKLRAKVLQAICTAMILEENGKDALERVRQAFPKTKVVKKQRPVLRVIKAREASEPGEGAEDAEDISRKLSEKPLTSLSTGYVDEDAWNQTVDDYKKEYVRPMSPRRGPRAKVVMPDGDERYEWEVENEIVQDFVERVRDGQIDAANAAGVTDFMWIAIIDNKTDDCCIWRDGLSSSEIEEELKGKHSDDECDATVPPAHFRCRCRPAPMLKSLPAVEPPDFGGFDEWLESA